MKRFISIVLLSMLLVPCSLRAGNIECVGEATQVVQGHDTIFIFRDEIHLRSKIGPIEWYRADGSIYASGCDEIYPEDGCYTAAGSAFCVALYKDIEDLAFTIEPTCDNTLLHVTGDLTSVYARACSIDYNALAWNTEAWVDSAANVTTTLKPTILLPALYGPTPITLSYDSEIRDALGLPPASVTVNLPLEDVKAVKMELVALATARENDPAGNNEMDRPTDQHLSPGKSYSGAVEVAFYSNPTPAARFYHWSIYKTSELIAQRHDISIRYDFSEPGSYRVVGQVNNEYCTSDSVETVINISESYLHVPNVFTPNGDGHNDEFRVAYRSLREFHCWVYNRWGKLVYQWSDPDKGWDGMIGGRPAAEGAYFYVIRAMGTDAAKNASYVGLKAVYQKRKTNSDASVIGVYQLSGDINLIRGK